MEIKTIPGTGGDQEVTLPTSVVRANQEGAGLSFSGTPSITGRNIRQMMRDSGPNFRRDFRELLGIRQVQTGPGRYRTTLNLQEAQIGVDEFSIRDLATEFLGHEFMGGLGNAKTAGHNTAVLREALAPVTASTFQDINAFNQLVGGLIEVRLLAGYQLPAFIAGSLMEEQPTRVNGGKLIGIPNVKLPDGPTLEGVEYPSIGLQERWAIAPANVKYGQKLAVTREAMVYDLTGEIASAAESMGKTLGYIEEYWRAAVIQGVDIAVATPGFIAGRTCNTFIYDGQPTDTPNATYQTAAGTGASLKYNYVNADTGMPLVDWRDLQTARSFLADMREFETGFPIVGIEELKDLVVAPHVLDNAKRIVHATDIYFGDAALSSARGLTMSGNPALNANVNIHSSAIWYKVLVDSGVSTSDAQARWYAGHMKKCFVWRSVWPLTVTQSNPLVPEMMGSDIVNAWYANWYGAAAIRDPHYCLRFDQ